MALRNKRVFRSPALVFSLLLLERCSFICTSCISPVLARKRQAAPCDRRTDVATVTIHSDILTLPPRNHRNNQLRTATDSIDLSTFSSVFFFFFCNKQYQYKKNAVESGVYHQKRPPCTRKTAKTEEGGLRSK